MAADLRLLCLDEMQFPNISEKRGNSRWDVFAAAQSGEFSARSGEFAARSGEFAARSGEFAARS
eukprot:1190462-Prorocentrum_minimum.AAC.4